ncbi:hypothetical protein [Streptomyces canus]|uniref:hypothetical protein n=1 Tax=Streptomyces canus TaxID=58343 RepID=UPI003CEFF3A9
MTAVTNQNRTEHTDHIDEPATDEATPEAGEEGNGIAEDDTAEIRFPEESGMGTDVPGAGQDGSKSLQGPEAKKSLQGQEGPKGLQGPQLPKSLQGQEGPKGFQGVQGPKSLQGQESPKGLQGPESPKSLQGQEEPKSFQGPQGPKSLQGGRGPSSPQEQTGPKNLQGPAKSVQPPAMPESRQGLEKKDARAEGEASQGGPVGSGAVGEQAAERVEGGPAPEADAGGRAGARQAAPPRA